MPESYKLFPVLALSLMKTKALKGGPVASDVRTFYMRIIKSIGVHATIEDPFALNLFTVPDRFRERGDLWAEIDAVHHSLQPLLDLYETQGEGDMPYPPEYPKMPGEPKRVQPSRDTDRPKE